MSAIEKQQGGTTWRKHNSFEATEDLVCWMLLRIGGKYSVTYLSSYLGRNQNVHAHLRAMRQALARRATGDPSREHKTAFGDRGSSP